MKKCKGKVAENIAGCVIATIPVQAAQVFLLKNEKFLVTRDSASGCSFVGPKYAATHLRASTGSPLNGEGEDGRIRVTEIVGGREIEGEKRGTKGDRIGRAERKEGDLDS
jgi:hypothetical protein